MNSAAIERKITRLDEGIAAEVYWDSVKRHLSDATRILMGDMTAERFAANYGASVREAEKRLGISQKKGDIPPSWCPRDITQTALVIGVPVWKLVRAAELLAARTAQEKLKEDEEKC